MRRGCFYISKSLSSETSASSNRSSWCRSCCSGVLHWPRFSIIPQTKCLHTRVAEALQRTSWTLVDPPVPIRSGTALNALGKQSSQEWQRWHHEGHRRHGGVSAPNLTALHQKAHAGAEQGKTAKKYEPDPEPPVEEVGTAGGDSWATRKTVKTLARSQVPVQLLPPGARASFPMAQGPCPVLSTGTSYCSPSYEQRDSPWHPMRLVATKAGRREQSHHYRPGL